MIEKVNMIENINEEINHLNQCIKDLEYKKQFIDDIDSDTERKISDFIDNNDEKFLISIIENNKCYLIFSKYSHLYEKIMIL